MANIIPIIVGGAIPAFLWGMTSILQRQSSMSGASPSVYLAIFGLSIFAAGLASLAFQPRQSVPSLGAITYAIMAGAGFAAGTGLVGMALWKYNFPISRLAPILSTNVLVTVAVGLLLGDVENVNSVRLLIGTALIIAGVVFVTVS
ncbi:hypothetical protein LAV84_22955 [Rhizobium sp. VS19-DR104.2]|uniref:hypothetical protein n=1 Tax=unclassified Rhizobium TaxID=2613769 RepID=UPI001C5A6D9A|nr:MULTISPECIES: hypothetical protein [unclassified Rhizobium]MBZ5762107.1 hypothetical protein [Rhizobium sp. VS19-DR96]MBZ5768220.1 hypothetical protein [Rhizobium sp. VS19-DR129.2]MBZ5775715.1 hypothetical protein [Rhizobium sp. VS19-DRK62.2]MBZ5786984.1 hypothetical protein [Rhizobium sp. VS19-DR121]MBZ5804145.1 hypothetical protein [Rhizobium sp. VS19-DR181]